MLQKLKENRDKLIYGGGAGLTTALVAAAPVFAEGTESTVSSTLLSEFTSGVNEIKALLLGIVGTVMVIIVLKLAFKSGVSFFKSAATK